MLIAFSALGVWLLLRSLVATIELLHSLPATNEDWIWY
jgi:uncharacterized membrane protein